MIPVSLLIRSQFRGSWNPIIITLQGRVPAQSRSPPLQHQGRFHLSFCKRHPPQGRMERYDYSDRAKNKSKGTRSGWPSRLDAKLWLSPRRPYLKSLCRGGIQAASIYVNRGAHARSGILARMRALLGKPESRSRQRSQTKTKNAQHTIFEACATFIIYKHGRRMYRMRPRPESPSCSLILCGLELWSLTQTLIFLFNDAHPLAGQCHCSG